MKHAKKYSSTFKKIRAIAIAIMLMAISLYSISKITKEQADVVQNTDAVNSETFYETDVTHVNAVPIATVAEKKNAKNKNAKKQPKKEYNYYYVYEESNDTCYYLKTEYQDFLWKMCEKYKVTDYYRIFIIMMYDESKFDEDSISETNDYGLMQINICNHEWLSEELGKDDFLDPYTNIESGVLILSNFIHKYSDTHIALTCYNKGESSYRKGVYSCAYSRKIMSDLNKLVIYESDERGL